MHGLFKNLFTFKNACLFKQEEKLIIQLQCQLQPILDE